jgi:hypothetical protein
MPRSRDFNILPNTETGTSLQYRIVLGLLVLALFPTTGVSAQQAEPEPGKEKQESPDRDKEAEKPAEPQQPDESPKEKEKPAEPQQPDKGPPAEAKPPAEEPEGEKKPEAAPPAEPEPGAGSGQPSGEQTEAVTDSGAQPEQPAAVQSEPAPEAEEPTTAPDAEATGEEPAAAGEEEEDGWGDETGWGGDDSAGFGESPAEEVAVEEAPPPPSNLTLDGFFRSRDALWVERMDDNPFAQARQSLDADLRYKRPFAMGGDRLVMRLQAGLHLEYDLAYLHERDSYDDPTLDEYEWQVIGRETFVSLTYRSLELTFGRQIVAWGQGYVLSPIDVVNPRDNREPYLVDLEDMRLAVLASRLGLYLGDHRLEGMILHEAYFGLKPPPMSTFSPLRKLLLDDPFIAQALEVKTLRYEEVPDRFVNQAGQYFGRWTYTGHGFDLSFYAASVLESFGVARLPDPSEYMQDEIDLEMWHPRYTMLANSGAVPVSDFLIRWEFAFDLDRPFGTIDTSAEELSVHLKRYDQVFGLLGVNYTGIDDTTVMFEYEQHYVLENPRRESADNPLRLLFPVEQPQIMLRVDHNALRERLNLNGLVLIMGIWDYTGWLARLELMYELQDAVKIGAGYMTYQPIDAFSNIYGFEDHDWIYAMFRWDFLLQ